MLRVMAKYSKIWKRVHAFSRRPLLEQQPSHFTTHAIDLYNTDPAGVAKQIREAGIESIDYAFFCEKRPRSRSQSK